MRKTRFFEFCDQAWAPQWYQEGLHDYLIFFYRTFGYHKLWQSSLKDFFDKEKQDKVLECCAGNGHCLPMIFDEGAEEFMGDKQMVMSDLYPHAESVEAFKESKHFSYYPDPVDVNAIPKELDHSKVFINSFHHLPPQVAQEVLQDSLDKGNQVLILEYVDHNPVTYISMLFGALTTFLTVPFVVKGSNKWKAMFFTYLIPLFPLMLWWDGWVSCWRSYQKKDIHDMMGESAKDLEIIGERKRSLLYPAGVTSTLVSVAEDADSKTLPAAA